MEPTEVRAKALISELIGDELQRILHIYGHFSSEHEAWAVMKEELEEAQEDFNAGVRKWADWWTRIREDNFDNVDLVDEIDQYVVEAIKELVQVAACCRKYRLSHLGEWISKKAERVGGKHDDR